MPFSGASKRVHRGKTKTSKDGTICSQKGETPELWVENVRAHTFFFVLTGSSPGNPRHTLAESFTVRFHFLLGGYPHLQSAFGSRGRTGRRLAHRRRTGASVLPARSTCHTSHTRHTAMRGDRTLHGTSQTRQLPAATASAHSPPPHFTQHSQHHHTLTHTHTLRMAIFSPSFFFLAHEHMLVSLVPRLDSSFVYLFPPSCCHCHSATHQIPQGGVMYRSHSSRRKQKTEKEKNQNHSPW